MTTMGATAGAVARPAADEYAPAFAEYIGRVAGDDVLARLEAQPGEWGPRLERAAGRPGFRYAEGKWSVRQVVGHMADAERVMVYRALCIARGETASLPGMDEDAYMGQSPFERLGLLEVTRELDAVRAASLHLFRHLAAEDWARTGTANDHRVSVRALAFIVAGHVEHHLAVLAERYGV